MRDEYDFSGAVRGKFFRGDRPYHVTVTIDGPLGHPHYEVYTHSDGSYRFRLVNDLTILLENEIAYPTKDLALLAIENLRPVAFLASTKVL